VKKQTTLSTDKYLTLCGQIEKHVADIYGHWSIASDHDAPVKELWKQMQDEENVHYSQIEILRRMVRGCEFGTHTVSDDEILQLAEHAEQTLEFVVNNDLSMPSALSLAIKLEDKFAKFHANQAFNCEDQSLAKMFNHLSRNDQEHAERLQTALQELCSVDTGAAA